MISSEYNYVSGRKVGVIKIISRMNSNEKSFNVDVNNNMKFSIVKI